MMRAIASLSLLILFPALASPEETLRTGLLRLQSAEFIYETMLFPALEYTFKHALTHDVAYGSLVTGRRKVLHARVVDALERLYSDRLGDQVERLAHHAVRGEAWEKAIGYLRQAGAKATSRAGNRARSSPASITPEARAASSQCRASSRSVVPARPRAK